MRIRAACLAFALEMLPKPASALLCGTVRIGVSTLSFGNYTPASDDYSNITVSVTCQLLGIGVLPDFSVALSAGNASGPSGRYLSNGGAPLGYNIYTSNGYGTVWGDGNGGSAPETYSSLLTLGSIDFTGYGRIPRGQYVPGGVYADQLTVTVTY